MADRSIIFSAPMVRALLDGRKTQTRRILKPKRGVTILDCTEDAGRALGGMARRMDLPLDLFQRPYAAGDRLYVREAWSHDGPDIETVRSRHEDALGGGVGYGPYYRATETAPDTLSWRPSIHMPRWASRLTLAVTEVRVERLSDIGRADAAAEGLIKLPATGRYVIERGDQYLGGAHSDPRMVFEMLWNSIHGRDAWAANPWVAAISFTVHRANIDALDIGAAA